MRFNGTLWMRLCNDLAKYLNKWLANLYFEYLQISYIRSMF